jgi:hypothetical protein
MTSGALAVTEFDCAIEFAARSIAQSAVAFYLAKFEVVDACPKG